LAMCRHSCCAKNQAAQNQLQRSQAKDGSFSLQRLTVHPEK
jgi:hypothetical protein